MRKRAEGTRRRGSALTELAVMSPLLLIILGAVIDFSRLFHVSMMLDSAAYAGARYALGKDSNQYDLEGIQQAAIASQPNMGGMQAMARIVCKMPPGDPEAENDGPEVECTSVTGYARQYLEVTTVKSYSVLSRYLSLPAQATLQGKAVVRLR